MVIMIVVITVLTYGTDEYSEPMYGPGDSDACLSSDSLVWMADKSLELLGNVRVGSRLWTPNGPREVVALDKGTSRKHKSVDKRLTWLKFTPTRMKYCVPAHIDSAKITTALFLRCRRDGTEEKQ